MSKIFAHGPIAVIDVETTGLFPYRHDRVVEIAAVILDERGAVEREFASLVNPERDIGPSSIHGLSSSDVVPAPRFAEIVGELLETMAGAVAIAAHNARFDRLFLQRELERIGADLPEMFMICTMELSGGGRLDDCCKLQRGPRRHRPSRAWRRPRSRWAAGNPARRRYGFEGQPRRVRRNWMAEYRRTAATSLDAGGVAPTPGATADVPATADRPGRRRRRSGRH